MPANSLSVRAGLARDFFLYALEPERNRYRFPSVRPHGGLLQFLNEQRLLQVLLDPIVTRAAAVDDQVV